MPPLPEAFYWIELTRAVNLYLGSSYTIAQVQALPGDQVLLLEMRLAAQYGPLDTGGIEDDV